MAKLSKRMRSIQEQAKERQTYSVEKALELLRSLPAVKFVQSVEADISVNINPKKSDQGVRGVVVLPHGTGRKSRIIVLSEDKGHIEEAISQGAYQAGFEDLVNSIKQGELVLNEKDTLIATPAAMKLLMPLGSMLGPKGLMPNPKLGTVTSDPVAALREALLGRVQYRNDKGAGVRCLIGKLSFSTEDLKANLQALLLSMLNNKPEAAPKGKAFIKRVMISSTMGPGLYVDQTSLDLSEVS